jgi:hypothetical protein
MTRLVMENSGLALWPVISLFIFGGSCIGMVLWLFRSGSGEVYRRMGAMALDDVDRAPIGGRQP